MLRHKPFSERVRLADELRNRGKQIAGSVADDLQLLDFLCAAIETGEAQALAGYLRWTCGVLDARGLTPSSVRNAVGRLLSRLESDLSPLPAAELVEFIDSALAAAALPAASLTPRPRPLSEVQSRYLQALLEGQRQAAVDIAVEAVHQGYALPDIYADVLQESMYQVGRLWETNRISVAKEHMATAITQHVIAHLYPFIQPVQPPRGRMVITGVEGEFHQVGPNIIADVLESQGWDVRFLGTNTPVASVLQAIDEHRAEVLGISATMLSNLPNVRRLMAQARAVDGLNLRIILGGSAFRVAPDLYRELGAEGMALDVVSALALCEGL
jgi:methanogenic corrinoid protein MtbC1